MHVLDVKEHDLFLYQQVVCHPCLGCMRSSRVEAFDEEGEDCVSDETLKVGPLCDRECWSLSHSGEKTGGHHSLG